MSVSLEFTEEQVLMVIKILNNYKKLRKSHFWLVDNGLKQQKITAEVVIIDGLIEYLAESIKK